MQGFGLKYRIFVFICLFEASVRPLTLPIRHCNRTMQHNEGTVQHNCGMVPRQSNVGMGFIHTDYTDSTDLLDKIYLWQSVKSV